MVGNTEKEETEEMDMDDMLSAKVYEYIKDQKTAEKSYLSYVKLIRQWRKL